MDFDEYPPELARAVGLVVMSAARAEDKAGELVQLTHQIANRHEQAAKGWAASGQQLVEAFRNVAAADLSDRLTRALTLRNEVIHGVFLGGKGSPPFWLTMKRQFSKRDPAAYGTAGEWTVSNLEALAQEFTDLENFIDDEISCAMGLKDRPLES